MIPLQSSSGLIDRVDDIDVHRGRSRHNHQFVFFGHDHQSESDIGSPLTAPKVSGGAKRPVTCMVPSDNFKDDVEVGVTEGHYSGAIPASMIASTVNHVVTGMTGLVMRVVLSV